MTLSSNQDDFVADDFEPEDDFVADDFEPDEPEEKSWFNTDYGAGIELNPFKSDKGAKLRQNTPKAIASGVTAGFSELIPGLKVDEDLPGSTTQKVAGSLLPIGVAMKGVEYGLRGAAKLAPKLVKPITSLGNLLGLSAVGGVYEGLEESAEKSFEAGEFVPPSTDTIIEQGTKWGLLDVGLRALGWSGRFAKGLYDVSVETGKPVIEVLENVVKEAGSNVKDIAQKALSFLEGKSLKQIEAEAFEKLATKDISPQAVEERVQQAKIDLRERKVSQELMDRVGAESQIKFEPYLPKEFEAEAIAEEVLSEDLTNRIESSAQRAPSELDLGKNIKGDIERTVETAKKETDALYDIAKQVEKESYPTLQKTADSIVEQINKLQGKGLKTKPEGYDKAAKQLRNVLTDLGYAIEQDASGNVVRAVENSRKPLSTVIDVKRRLNNIINYDLLETSANDFLKDPAFKLREEIRNGYGAKNSEARKAFEEAEKKFGEFAEKKGKKSIRNIRQSEKPESIAKTIKTPSGLADVKEVVSPEQFAQVEREILEHIKGLNEQKAAEYYREIRPAMSTESKSLAEEIIQSKAPKNSPNRKVAQREAIQNKAVEDIARATITGERPEVALKLWKTTEGQQLIKNTLENNPNKAEVLKYLEEQSFKDFASSVVKPDGKVDFKSLNNLLADKATAANIRLVAGEEGYQFLKNLEQLSKRVEKNASIIEGKIDKGSARERESIRKEIDKKGQERLKKTKQKNIENQTSKKQAVSDRYQGAIEESIGKRTASNRKAVEEQATRSGERKFEAIRGKKEAEEAARVAAEKSGLLYKLDDLIGTYGYKGKGVLTALGILKFGAPEAILGAAGYEAFMFLARNKNVHRAFRKAALPKSSPVELVRSLTGLLDELD